MKTRHSAPTPLRAGYEPGPVAREMARRLHDAHLARVTPARPSLVTVDIPPRPMPGRRTAPSIDPAAVTPRRHD